ncbi:MAG: uracil-DNA glycosylase family protein [Proteobacteria bacterium]|nr:uracil-DNA glycosylase family protein [Pseudomonadota bacterium]MBS0302381.1 uracil-DNA glycosylase family protein [Pseudomonadota bacterium]
MPAPADDETLDALLLRVRACRICAAHLPLGPRPVLQAGSGARILLASQAPGRKVHASGIPFDDASGERLRGWLGVTPAQFYDPESFAILPMGFCYPGRGPSGDLPPRPECAPAWRAPLLARLPHLQLTLVIGQYALAWHVPDAPRNLTEAVRAWCGDAHHNERHTLVLPHPSPRNNGWFKRNPWFEAELLPLLRARVAEVLAGSPPELGAGLPPARK